MFSSRGTGDLEVVELSPVIEAPIVVDVVEAPVVVDVAEAPVVLVPGLVVLIINSINFFRKGIP